MIGLKQILVCLLLLCGIGVVKAQNVEYGVALDTNYMLIGDQQHLTFEVRSDGQVKVVFPLLRDTVVKGVEIIAGPVRDSVREKDGKWLIKEKYLITAFDSGVYVIPPMPVKIENQEYNNILRTEPVAFVVNTFQVDPQKGNYDIVLPYDAPWTFAEILPYLLWTLLGLAIILLGIWYWQRRKKNRPLFVARKEEIPPYIKAIRSLDEIKGEKLWQAGYEKEFYTRLTDTVRQYLDEEFGISAMEQTSGETITALKSNRDIESKECDKLENMLTTADFVKFAKYTPLQDENARHLDVAYEFVSTTHQRLQNRLAEQEKAAEEERKRREEEESRTADTDKKEESNKSYNEG